MNGGSLAEFIASEAAIVWNSKWFIAKEIAAAMEYLHKQGLFHRDLASKVSVCFFFEDWRSHKNLYLNLWRLKIFIWTSYMKLLFKSRWNKRSSEYFIARDVFCCIFCQKVLKLVLAQIYVFAVWLFLF